MILKATKSAVLVALAAVIPALADSASNVQKLQRAANELDFVLPENRAVFLVKNETVRSEVGLIFGYADN